MASTKKRKTTTDPYVTVLLIVKQSTRARWAERAVLGGYLIGEWAEKVLDNAYRNNDDGDRCCGEDPRH